MPETIIIALIGVGGSAIGSFVGIVANSRLMKYRLEQLEKKVDRHNSLIERTYRLEQSMAVQDEKITVANHRIEDIERSIT